MKRRENHPINDPDLQVTQLEDGHLEVRETLVDADGNQYYHRYVVHPGMHTGGKDVRVDLLAKRVHTPKVVADFTEAERLRELRELNRA